MSRWKFDDCVSCANRRRKHICRDCEVGEFYEDEDEPTVDRAFEVAPSRFGESVIDDEDEGDSKRLDAGLMMNEIPETDPNDDP